MANRPATPHEVAHAKPDIGLYRVAPIVLIVHALLSTAIVVALQVVLPRLFSVVLWYHLGFFAVSLAMLGGAAGAYGVARKARAGALPNSGALLGCGGLALALAALVVLRLEIDPTALLSDPIAATKLLALPIVLAIPFALLGAAITTTLASAGAALGPIYGATFAGGALGAILGYYGMEFVGAPRAIGLLVLLAAAAGGRASLQGSGLAAGILGAAILAAPDDLLPTRSMKHFPNVSEEQILQEDWNASTHVTFYDNPERHGLWELPGRYTGALPQSIGVAIDAWAITSILKFETPNQRLFFGAYPPTLAFVDAKPGFSTLVIGAGGGVDVEAALAAGSGHVTAVEINPLIVDAVRGRFREWSNDLYGRADVDAVVAEGRHYAETTDTLFDRVVLTGVDTFAATQAGAFALSENHLYTVEAMRAWLDRLAPDGRVTFTRWWYEPKRQTLRLLLTLDRAMRDAGIADPRKRIFAARTALNSVVVVKNGDFTIEETDALIGGLGPRGLALVHSPDGRGGDARFIDFLDPQKREASLRDWPYRVEPSTDDWPFFFEYTRLDRLFATEGDWIHDRLGGLELVFLALAALLALALPLAWAALRGAVQPGARTLIFACVLLGVGYVLVEAPLLSRLALVLGHPSKAITVVLTALLLGSGIGACFASRIDAARAARVTLAAAVVVVAILAFGHAELVDAVAGATSSARVVATLVYLAVPAFVLGLPFPLALRAFDANAETIARANVLNGVGSALAGPLAMLIALQFGLTDTIVAGAVCYALAAWILVRVQSAR